MKNYILLEAMIALVTAGLIALVVPGLPMLKCLAAGFLVCWLNNLVAERHWEYYRGKV